MERLLNVLAILSALLILYILRSVRGQHIRVEYSVSWLGAALTLLLLSRSQWVLERAAALFGVADPALALLFIVLSVFLGVFYRFSVVISALKDANIALTQKVAILEYRIQHIDEENQAQESR
jgi:hypothetical protein